MTEKYKNAACRHFDDARILQSAGKIDNAGHLIGFAAECAIKFQISSLQPGGDTVYGHLPNILIAARKHLGPRSRYSGMYGIIKGEIFEDGM